MAKKVKKVTKKAAAKKSVKKKTVTKRVTKKKKAVKKKTAAKKAVKKTTRSAAKTSSTTAKKKKAVQKTASKKSVRKTAKKKTAKKKTTRQKTASKKTTVKRRIRPKTTLSSADLEHFRALLVEKLREISGDVNHIELESLRGSRQDASGDLSSMPIHMADVGSDNYEQEFSLGLMDSERKIVLEIMAALKRIDNKTYGICEGTQELIPRPRLEGIPWTRYCVQYAEMLEKGLVTLDQDWYDEEQEPADMDEDDFDGDLDEEDFDEDVPELYYGFDDEDD